MNKEREERRGTDIPDRDLDEWLAERERSAGAVVRGTEKTIRWAGEPGDKTALSLVYLHGFSASRQEIAPVMDIVSEGLETNLFYTRFTGHGLGADELGEATIDDWKRDTREAWEIGRSIGGRVIVVGTSTGAPLAAWLAAEMSAEGAKSSRGAQSAPGASRVAQAGEVNSRAVAELAGLVLISPNFSPAARGSNMLLWPAGRLIARLVIGKYREFEPENERHARYWTQRYRSEALVPMMKAVRLGKRADLESIRVPILFVYTEHDDVVSIPEALAAYGRIGSATKELVNLEGADDHVLAGDIISPHTTDRLASHMVRFIRNNVQ